MELPRSRADVPVVLGGISPIDPHFIERMQRQGVLEKVDVVAFDELHLVAVSRFDDIEFRHLSVYDVARLGERFDVVLFMGVL